MKEWLSVLADTTWGWALSVALGLLHLWKRIEDRAFERFDRRLKAAITWNEELEAELEEQREARDQMREDLDEAKRHARECDEALEILEEETGLDIEAAKRRRRRREEEVPE